MPQKFHLRDKHLSSLLCWTRKELRKMDERKTKLMMIDKDLRREMTYAKKRSDKKTRQHSRHATNEGFEKCTKMDYRKTNSNS